MIVASPYELPADASVSWEDYLRGDGYAFVATSVGYVDTAPRVSDVDLDLAGGRKHQSDLVTQPVAGSDGDRVRISDSNGARTDAHREGDRLVFDPRGRRRLHARSEEDSA